MSIMTVINYVNSIKHFSGDIFTLQVAQLERVKSCLHRQAMERKNIENEKFYRKRKYYFLLTFVAFCALALTNFEVVVDKNIN